MFDDIVDDEIEELKEMLKNNQLSNNECNNFIIDNEWEGEFSHNEIDEMQEKFIKQATEYLKEHYPNKYIIYCDWCVHICTIDFANKNIKNNRVIIC
ncbi:hypothetical protein G8V07_14320 [Clostridium botulinum D/C]|uniref:hypothetical protein n=1 Tax=Clostridium botulinum TaxID=1491 RepID=UPI001E611F00|nr:hypothetical protein [Clostridium botulinum]MCD3321635.1 hypothetical protein [Clostridium botulinum D/C]MCD3324900.1 hypothetical protein [Clostridium botulinum D/C]MCD3328161.1 hypothetical protein [Clostridium botulinum D/C]